MSLLISDVDMRSDVIELSFETDGGALVVDWLLMFSVVDGMLEGVAAVTIFDSGSVFVTAVWILVW